MTKIMVLAGGHDQAAFIRELRLLIDDVYVILIDMNPNVLAAKEADFMLKEEPYVKLMALKNLYKRALLTNFCQLPLWVLGRIHHHQAVTV